uniref:Uncharacterized protein n=1 Tax=Panagrolaimus davidi TaxID=227884 RepID=A0A914PF66_9BILA
MLIFDNQMNALLDYFEDTYVGRLNADGTRCDTFVLIARRVQMSKYQKVSADLQRSRQDFMAGNTAIIRFLTQCANKIKPGGNS